MFSSLFLKRWTFFILSGFILISRKSSFTMSSSYFFLFDASESVEFKIKKNLLQKDIEQLSACIAGLAKLDASFNIAKDDCRLEIKKYSNVSADDNGYGYYKFEPTDEIDDVVYENFDSKQDKTETEERCLEYKNISKPTTVYEEAIGFLNHNLTPDFNHEYYDFDVNLKSY
jgi:hypothetical protein